MQENPTELHLSPPVSNWCQHRHFWHQGHLQAWTEWDSWCTKKTPNFIYLGSWIHRIWGFWSCLPLWLPADAWGLLVLWKFDVFLLIWDIQTATFPQEQRFLGCLAQQIPQMTFPREAPRSEAAAPAEEKSLFPAKAKRGALENIRLDIQWSRKHSPDGSFTRVTGMGSSIFPGGAGKGALLPLQQSHLECREWAQRKRDLLRKVWLCLHTKQGKT